MGLFTRKRRDAKIIKPTGAIDGIFPFIFDKKVDAEVSSTIDIDIEELCKYVDRKNKSGDLEYKMTYFHAILYCFGIVFLKREKLNRFIKNKTLYERPTTSFAFMAKDKMSDDAEEKMIFIELDPKDTCVSMSKKLAIDVFHSKHNGDNSMDDVIKYFLKLPKWLLSLVVGIVKWMDKKGINPKALTTGDTNYSTVIFSNLGSIKSNSCYHHLSEYGTNSIIITIGTIRKVDGRRTVDMTFTLDERIADGFYFAKSVNMAQEIMKNSELFDKELGQDYDFEN